MMLYNRERKKKQKTEELSKKLLQNFTDSDDPLNHRKSAGKESRGNTIFQ